MEIPQPPFDIAAAWRAVLKHDRRRDADFVYAVASTGIYCRPSCPSRRPARRHVAFFGSPRAAERAGFRPCRRCRPDLSPAAPAPWLEKAREVLDGHADESITLDKLAAAVGASPAHLHRTFKQAFGLSPKEYQDARRMARLKAALKNGSRVTDATYEAGFSSGSRVYARAGSGLGMTPAAYRAGAAGLTIRFATVPTFLGRMLVAVTDRGIAAVSLGEAAAPLVAALQREYPKAVLRRDLARVKPYLRALLRCLSQADGAAQLPVDLTALRATAFQRRVWKALQRIPRGKTVSYADLARAAGKATAARAVARACAANRLAIAVPCHRVLRRDGQPAGYRWGLDRKRQLLARERQPGA